MLDILDLDTIRTQIANKCDQIFKPKFISTVRYFVYDITVL